MSAQLNTMIKNLRDQEAVLESDLATVRAMLAAAGATATAAPGKVRGTRKRNGVEQKPTIESFISNLS